MSELDFWRSYSSHLCETQKQFYYLQMTGLLQDEFGYSIDLQGKSVLEIGAGPCGILLRCFNGRRKIIEPAPYPNWVFERYEEQGVEIGRYRVEDMPDTGFDEVWVFNVLQHVDDLELAISRIKGSAKVLRIFEYLNQPTNNEHKHTLTKERLDELFGIDGKTTFWQKPYMYTGEVYYGVYNLASPELTIEIYGTFRAMCQFLKERYLSKVRVGAEIGTLAGDHAELLLRNLCLSKLYLIDPYEEDYAPSFGWQNISALMAFKQAKEKTEHFRNIVQFIRLRSDEASEFFRRRGVRFDFVYIDGDHSDEWFRRDFENFFPLTNYVIGGHDYLNEAGEEDWWSQVKDKISEPNKSKDEIIRKYMAIKYELPALLTKYNITKLYLGDTPYADWWIEKI